MVTAIDNNGNDRQMYENIWWFERVGVVATNEAHKNVKKVAVATGGRDNG